jgi:hypothetical protein
MVTNKGNIRAKVNKRLEVFYQCSLVGYNLLWFGTVIRYLFFALKS